MRIADIPAARIDPAGRLREIRGDHVARYRWAAARLTGHVIDAGCNCGYGSAILADAGLDVTGIDIREDAIEFARERWARAGVRLICGDLSARPALPPADALVAFELIEHLADPWSLLRAARGMVGTLLASVPNEAVWPWEARLAPVHHRHYRRAELEALLIECGWSIASWWGQAGGWSPVEPEVEGRTLVVECLAV